MVLITLRFDKQTIILINKVESLKVDTSVICGSVLFSPLRYNLLYFYLNGTDMIVFGGNPKASFL